MLVQPEEQIYVDAKHTMYEILSKVTNQVTLIESWQMGTVLFKLQEGWFTTSCVYFTNFDLTLLI